MGEPMQVAAVILAAGASTRFGSQKQRARIGDRTMLESVIAVAREAGLSPVVAVVPPGLAVPADVVPVINGHPDLGISRSLQLGLAAVPPEATAAVILLGDEPMIRATDVRDVVDADTPTPRQIIASRAGSRIGPPLLLPRAHFGLAEAAQGDHGLGPLVADHPALTLVDLRVDPIDVDTPADLERLGEP